MQVIIPHRDDVKIQSIVVSLNYLAVFERVDGLQARPILQDIEAGPKLVPSGLGGPGGKRGASMPPTPLFLLSSHILFVFPSTFLGATRSHNQR